MLWKEPKNYAVWVSETAVAADAVQNVREIRLQAAVLEVRIDLRDAARGFRMSRAKPMTSLSAQWHSASGSIHKCL
jgi:hypothetical protein